MSHTLHHLRWLVRRFRLPLVVFTLSWVLLLVAVWTAPITDWDGLSLLAHVVLMVPPLLLVIAVVWQDEARGTESFWRTRPPRWRAVWLSQMLFIITCLAGPPIFCWAANGLLMQHTAVQWKYGAIDLLFILCPFLALAGLASFSRNWNTLALLLAGAALATTGGVMGMISVANYFSGRQFQSGIYIPFMVIVWGVPALVMMLSWMSAMRRGCSLKLGLTALLWLISLPSLVWIVWRPRAKITVLEIIAATPGAPLQSGDQAAGVFLLRGLPEGVEARIRENHLRLDNLSHTDDSPAGKLLWISLQSNAKNPDAALRPGLLSPRAGSTIRAALPSATRWYADVQDSGKPFIWELGNWAGAVPIVRNLLGDTEGILLSSVPLVTVPLEEGATAAANGSRVRVHRLSHDAENLYVNVHLWLAAGLGITMAPAGIMGDAVYPESDPLPVLYFPAIPMAMLLKNPQATGKFRSWQCNTLRYDLRLSMPDIELTRGMRFTPGTLDGAQLLCFSQVQHGRFRVDYSAEPLKLIPP